MVDLTARLLNRVSPGDDGVPVDPDAPDTRTDPNTVVRRQLIQQQNRLPQDEIFKLIASYVGGTPVSELAQQFDVMESTVYDHIDREGTPRQPYRKLRPAQIAEGVELYLAGVSLRQVARLQCGVHPR